VPIDQRIATFDNDGTLWAEQPIYFQVVFALDRLKVVAAEHPEMRAKQPFGAALSKDLPFMRPWVGKAYGIPPEQVVGSSEVVQFRMRPDGTPELIKLAKVEFVDDGPGKPVGINRFIGRRPIFAFGNSDGDQQMLEWTAADRGGASWASCTTPMPCASGPMTANHTSAGSTRRSMRPRGAVGPWST
jgi:hypothetical protein